MSLKSTGGRLNHAKPAIRLYTCAMSPYAAKIHCLLLYERLDFEPLYVDPLRVRKDLSVGRQIPVLSLGDESRADSNPSGLWLDERFPDAPRLLPPDGPERERLLGVDSWASGRCRIRHADCRKRQGRRAERPCGAAGAPPTRRISGTNRAMDPSHGGKAADAPQRGSGGVALAAR